MLTWDLETKGLGGDLVIGGIYDGSHYFEFETLDKMVSYLRFMVPNDTIYAHNGGKYDNRYLLNHLKGEGYEISNIMYIQNGLIFDVKIGKKTFKVRDSIHLLQGSLKSLCESFNVEHKKREFDLKTWIKTGCPVTDELREYLKDDCISLYEVLLKFNSTFDTKIKLTIASTAFNALLETTYKNIKLKKLCSNMMTKEEEDFVRCSYKGGRVEVFSREAENVYSYDVNSLYPFVMHNFNYPFGKKLIQEGEECNKSIKLGLLGVCECLIKAPEMYIPYLAVRYEDKLMFPYGHWSDKLTSLEIIEARKRGYEIKIIKGIFWNNKGRLFKNYVDEYYSIKQNSEGAKKAIAKLFLNSSYGKFGQKRSNKRIKSESEMIKSGTDINKVESFDGGFLYSVEETSYQNRSVNPIYATFVTAYARHVLYLGFEHVMSKGGKIFYCDTDSIKTNVEMDKDFIDSEILGKWKDEGFFEQCIFVSPKLYCMEGEKEKIFKGKGIPKSELEKLSKTDYENLLKGEKITVETERVTGVMEHFRRKDTDKKKYIGSIKQQKIVTSDYTKRIVKNDGETEPIKIELLTDYELTLF